MVRGKDIEDKFVIGRKPIRQRGKPKKGDAREQASPFFGLLLYNMFNAFMLKLH
jgi:hypothetical protein